MRKPSCCTRRIIRTGTWTCRARSGTCRSCPRRPSTIFSAALPRGCSSCRRAMRRSARTSGSSTISWADAVPLDANAAVEKLRPHPEERALARVSKDGCTALTRRHPSRRALWALLRMRSEFFRRLECEHTFMSMSRHRVAISFTIAAVLAAASAACAQAQDSVEAFYKGRQINLIVGYGPGGGYDLTARLLARHIARYIPGSPSVAVQNMVGAGSLRAANYLYGAAPKDGATFGVFGSDIAMIGLIGGNAAVQFDARKFTWLGSASSFRDDAYVLILRPGPKSPSLI